MQSRSKTWCDRILKKSGRSCSAIRLDGMVQNPDEFHIPAYCPFSKPIERGLSNVNHFIRKFIVEFLYDDPILVIRKAFEEYILVHKTITVWIMLL